jgi:hypothetical protein
MPAVDEKDRTIIVYDEGDIDVAWRATQDALIAHNCPVYVRGRRLVQPLWRWEQAGGPGSGRCKKGGRKAVESYPLLDVNRLLVMGCLRPGWSGTWQWPDGNVLRSPYALRLRGCISPIASASATGNGKT